MGNLYLVLNIIITLLMTVLTVLIYIGLKHWVSTGTYNGEKFEC